MQSRLVAFQGVHGAYSELAARQLLGESFQTFPCETFDDVFLAVVKGKASHAAIPIENSLAGSIHQNYDLLQQHPLHIIAETYVRVEHALLCHVDSSLAEIKRVRSHPQALAQCSDFFRAHRKIKAEAFYDTAGAAQSLAEEHLTDVAAIAGAHAADLYHLKVLRHNLENQKHNFTRFLLISKKNKKPDIDTINKSYKCSLTFDPPKDQAGLLFKVLGVFALREINLLKIESRPLPSEAFAYRFYLDIEGHIQDSRVAKAIDHLGEVANSLRVLGCYPSAIHTTKHTTKSKSIRSRK